MNLYCAVKVYSTDVGKISPGKKYGTAQSQPQNVRWAEEALSHFLPGAEMIIYFREKTKLIGKINPSVTDN